MKKILALVSVFVLILAGCGSNDKDKAISISGSTSVEDFMNNTIKPAYEDKTANTIEYQSNGSSAGIKAAQNGTTTFGTSSRDLTKDEVDSGLQQEVLAIDGIAVIVNPANGVSDLTSDQIKDIYTGKITNWKDVGGKDGDIQIVSREDGSGTRSAFEELLGIEGKVSEDATISDGNGNVANTVAENESAIGYISFETLYSNQDKVKGLKLNGIEPTAKNVQADKYALSRPFLLVYMEDNLDDTDKEFIKFIQENKADLAPEAGLIEVNE